MVCYADRFLTKPQLAGADQPAVHHVEHQGRSCLLYTSRCVEETALDVVMGPRSDWFTPAAIERLSSQLWRVMPQSNRVGIRLELSLIHI